MKGKIIALILCFAIIFCGGVGVAYYNTKSFGFDEDAKLVSKDNEKFTVLDFDIYYNDINNFIEKAKDFIPDFHFTI